MSSCSVSKTLRHLTVGLWVVISLSGVLLHPGKVRADVAGSGTAAPILTVETTVPERVDWPIEIVASGWFAPWHEATIASEIDGLRIEEVLVDVGDIVKKGQVLARLAKGTVEMELRRLEAAEKVAEADYAKAKATSGRTRTLKSNGAVALQVAEDNEFAEASASAALASAKAAVNAQQIKLMQTEILAVDDGTISSRAARLGAVVSVGTELFRLIRQQRVEWQAEIPARWLDKINAGNPVEVFAGGTASIQGRVRAIDPAANKETGRAVAYVAMELSSRPMAGTYASGNVISGHTQALAIPESALVLRDGLTYVFTMDGKRQVHRTRVETGRRRNGNVEVLSGIDARALVVVTGGAFLSEGAQVAVTDRQAGGLK